ncbi:hypothetical protein [Brevundimonas sp. M20]|uniref:hypothetical protein n=1 Tax=Brevundimonas sp. M20 TaxID=2591463 RepID=UPI0011462CD5|nr:hypothetical protein [Brevundimonas sp. M20]QDH74409.1 hypothetical protein FKQ52_13855 [Brevundimonas sp. M20]
MYVMIVVALLGPPVLLWIYQGGNRVEAVLRERAHLSAEDQLELVNTGAFLRDDGRADRGSRLWCGRVNGDPTRGVAALESRGRAGRIDFTGSALAWAPRSDRERRMIVQCRERL